MTDKLRKQAAEAGIEPIAMLQYGNIATMRMKALTGGAEVRLVFPDGDGKKDRYGRLLAYVETESAGDLGAVLLREGLAWEYDCRHPRRKLYREHVTQARADRAGVWRCRRDKAAHVPL